MKLPDDLITGDLPGILSQNVAVIPAQSSVSSLLAMSPTGTKQYGYIEVLAGNPNKDLLAPLLYSTNKIRVEAYEWHQQWNRTAFALFQCVGAIASKMDTLLLELTELRKAKTYVVPLTTLANEPLQMRLSIPATIEGSGEEFTATFSEANVSASGETEADAIANLKDSLVSTFEFLESLPEKELGPLPARQWNVLKNVLTR